MKSNFAEFELANQDAYNSRKEMLGIEGLPEETEIDSKKVVDDYQQVPI
jgi:hypothetical protein